jgi:cold-inducible RNA-binding protein
MLSAGAEVVMKNIYVGNLSSKTSEGSLREEFAKYGEVSSVKILQDGMTHRSRGFGFVEMADDKSALDAIAELNGSSLDGRTIVVNEARPRSERETIDHGPRRRFGT